MRVWLVMVVGLWLTTAHAFELQSVQLDKKHKRYIVEMTVLVDIPESTFRKQLQNPETVTRLTPSIVSLQRLPSPAYWKTRFSNQYHTCVGIFCFDYKNTVDMQIRENGDIELDIVPQLSDFNYGRAIWRTRAVSAEQTHLYFKTENEPNFWIPPVVGDSLLKTTSIDMIKTMIQRMECEHLKQPGCMKIGDTSADNSISDDDF